MLFQESADEVLNRIVRVLSFDDALRSDPLTLPTYVPTELFFFGSSRESLRPAISALQPHSEANKDPNFNNNNSSVYEIYALTRLRARSQQSALLMRSAQLRQRRRFFKSDERLCA